MNTRTRRSRLLCAGFATLAAAGLLLTSAPAAHAETIFGIRESQWTKVKATEAAAITAALPGQESVPDECWEVRRNRAFSAYAIFSTKGYNPDTPQCPSPEPEYSGLVKKSGNGWTFLGSRGGSYWTCSDLRGKAPYVVLSQAGCSGSAQVRVPFASKLTLGGYKDCTPVSRLFGSPDWYMRGCTDGQYGSWGLWKVTKGKVVAKTSLFSRALSSPDCGASLLKAPNKVKSDLFFTLAVDNIANSNYGRFFSCGAETSR